MLKSQSIFFFNFYLETILNKNESTNKIMIIMKIFNSGEIT